MLLLKFYGVNMLINSLIYMVKKEGKISFDTKSNSLI